MDNPTYFIDWDKIQKMVIVNFDDRAVMSFTTPWYTFRNQIWELPANTVTIICMCNEGFRFAASRVFTKITCDNQHYLQPLGESCDPGTNIFIVHPKSRHMPLTLLEITIANLVVTNNNIKELPVTLQNAIHMPQIKPKLQLYVGYKFYPVEHLSCRCNMDNSDYDRVRFLRARDLIDPD